MDNPYFYPGTNVLQNRLDIRDLEELKAAETAIGLSGLDRLDSRPLHSPFGLDRLKETHRALCEGLYDWAGKLREHGSMSKDRQAGYQVSYGPSTFVPQELERIFGQLKAENFLKDIKQPQLAGKLAFYYGELDAIHPFPDLNSRTLRRFTSDLAKSVGYDMSWQNVSDTERKREVLFHARDQAVMRGDHAGLERVFAAGLQEIDRTRETQRQLDQQQSGPQQQPRASGPLSIRRNSYPEADRQAAQEQTAAVIERDAEPFFEAYNHRPESMQGRYICSDLFKETFPQFAASSEGRARYNNPLHNSAAVLAATQLTRAIADTTHPERDTVVFLTGIPGAGKTTAILKGGELEPDIRAVFEGQLADSTSAIEKIQAVLDAGLKPAVLAVHAAPEFALQNTLSRFEREGRGASLHAMSTIQSQLPTALAAIRDAFGDKVQFDIFDRTAGLNQTVKQSGWSNLPVLAKEGSYASIRERLTAALDQHHAAGTISEDGYRQAAGLATLARPGEAIQQDAGRAQQLPQPGVDTRAAPSVERRGALR